MAGTIMYAYFHGCDPLATAEVGATDQVGKIYRLLSVTFLLIFFIDNCFT